MLRLQTAERDANQGWGLCQKNGVIGPAKQKQTRRVVPQQALRHTTLLNLANDDR